jgi:hypothetical protein
MSFLSKKPTSLIFKALQLWLESGLADNMLSATASDILSAKKKFVCAFK